jgi:hypothetical protein
MIDYYVCNDEFIMNSMNFTSSWFTSNSAMPNSGGQDAADTLIMGGAPTRSLRIHIRRSGDAAPSRDRRRVSVEEE